ncbi:hypothetical protein GOZ83_06430 [Agrobacterium vitis]|uniref:hypothetical protein n=1 Tax=Rhizobium/Agrobacterium group TaxID=227290 RepID=UPI0012E7188D|nr:MULTISPECIES: hypothetical protein [Rhizobium/Agrobacterium group]MCF1492674.1 hypothetical protein [Allorhizobium ampelinum]MVA44718.1 hypothetical protein [Agrobacterium vitis]
MGELDFFAFGSLGDLHHAAGAALPAVWLGRRHGGTEGLVKGPAIGCRLIGCRDGGGGTGQIAGFVILEALRAEGGFGVRQLAVLANRHIYSDSARMCVSAHFGQTGSNRFLFFIMNIRSINSFFSMSRFTNTLSILPSYSSLFSIYSIIFEILDADLRVVILLDIAWSSLERNRTVPPSYSGLMHTYLYMSVSKFLNSLKPAQNILLTYDVFFISPCISHFNNMTASLI